MTAGLGAFLGTSEVRFGVTSVVFPGEVRTYARFSDALDEILEARIWAGLHFRTADVQGRALGEAVADHVLAGFFQKVGG